MSQNPESQIQALLDRESITRVLFNYARGCDRADELLLRSCFHPDSRHQHGSFTGTSAEFCTVAMQIIRGVKGARHAISNVTIDLQGTIAFSECLYDAWHRRPQGASGGEEDYFTGGRYLDRFEKRDGEWRIVQRRGLIDYERVDPATSGSERPAHVYSGRWPDDPVYQHLPSLRR